MNHLIQVLALETLLEFVDHEYFQMAKFIGDVNIYTRGEK